eukprot:TRINITY_DN535_c9_g1_i1.p1 TRINITY_DN535_c9_g1~~TRINITY_DN535_c9_g1_i1.p1  ORF type:complete len:513 (+),score=212.00 TRINITY_DN535_c9_g1_i1:87-1625(+)
MSSMNAVDSLLARLGLSDYIGEFRARGLGNAKMLKNLGHDELAEIFHDPAVLEKFKQAITHDEAQQQSQAGRGMFDSPGMSRDFERRQGGKGSRRPQQYERPRSAGRGPPGYVGGGDYGGYGGGQQDQWEEDVAAPTSLPSGEGVVEVSVAVPHYTVPFLLGQRAQKLNQIHSKFGTTNSRINRPEGTLQSEEVVFALYGQPGQVQQAKDEIEKLVGIAKQNKTNQKFQELLLGRTKIVTALLYALNERRAAASLPTALSPETIPENVSQFLFCNPYAHIRQFCIRVSESARRKFDLIGQVMYQLKTVQCLCFCSNNKHLSDVLLKRVVKEQLSGMKPLFLHPGLHADEKKKVLEEFRVGYGPLDKYKLKKKDKEAPKEDWPVEEEIKGGFEGDKNRLLITSDDYARFARQKAIPYVGFVINYDLPKTKEGYLHRIACAGRAIGADGGQRTRGAVITLVSDQDLARIEELRRFGLRIDELPGNFDGSIEIVQTDEMCQPFFMQGDAKEEKKK